MRESFFYLTVQDYKSVNNMGLELGRYIWKKYDKVVVNKSCMNDIIDDIKKKMSELLEKHPRCRPFQLESFSSKDRHQNEHIQYSVSSNTSTDSYVVVLYADPIRRLNLEPELNL